MTLRRLALVLAMAVAGAGAGTGLAAPGSDIPYTKRLQILEALATRYPGHVEAKNQLGRYGLWAGIVAQTTWQQRTHRDRIPLWAIVNYSLSVQPTGFATLLEHAGTKADPASVCALRLDRDVCRGWAAYFAAVRKGQPPQTLLKLLWHAHTTAIVDRLHTQRAELDKVHTTPLERRFWASWIEIVFLLEASHFPTDGATSTRASALLMPPCSPLGAPGCRLRVHDLGHTYPFVSVLARRRSSVDRALREYTTLRTNPAALQTLAISDPKLASALALYLAVAR